MAAKLQAEQAQLKIERAAEKAVARLREIKAMEVGQAIRQGDIYVTRIDALPKPLGGVTAERQLAPGTSRGSRHCVEGEVTVYLPPAGADALTGPVIHALGRCTITHPEHAHFSLPPGFYQVTYQRDFGREELARVHD